MLGMFHVLITVANRFKFTRIKKIKDLFTSKSFREERERDSSIRWLIPQMAITVRARPVQAGSQSFWVYHTGLGKQGLHCCPRPLALSWTKSGVAGKQAGTHMECQCHRWRITQLCHNTSTEMSI